MVAFVPLASLQRGKERTGGLSNTLMNALATLGNRTEEPFALPVLLPFQQFPVGGDLNVQSQLDVHELLVLTDLAGHILFGSLQGVLQVLDTGLGVLDSQLTALLRLGDLGVQVAAL